MQQVTLLEPGKFALQLTDRVARAGGEALVRVHRIGVCGTDLHAFAGRQPFFNYPRVLGHELAVEVIEAPANDRGIAIGTRCSVEPYLNCGACSACRRGKSNCCENLKVLGVHIDGGMRPFINVPVDKLHPSSKLTLDQLALVETLGIGAHAVERAAIQPGQSVLIIGAGPIGLSAIQFAQIAGGEVIVMDLDDSRLAFCRNTLGVTRTVNPGQGDVLEMVRALNGGDLPTVVMDATGHPASMAAAFERVAPGGRIVFIGLFIGDVTFHDPLFHRREITLLASRNALPETFTRIIGLIESGRLDTTPWITHRMTLDQVPGHFAGLHGTQGLIKAMIDVPDELTK